jgi:hypothetical protein
VSVLTRADLERLANRDDLVAEVRRLKRIEDAARAEVQRLGAEALPGLAAALEDDGDS